MIKDALSQAVDENGLLTEEEIAEKTRNSHFINFKALLGLVNDYFKYAPLSMNDKYKHALINCEAAKRGTGGALIGSSISELKELYDVKSGRNTRQESENDNTANALGRFLGYKYPEKECEEVLQKYLKRDIK